MRWFAPSVMPTSGSADLLADTSVAIPLIAADHERHDAVRQAVVGKRLGLAGHAWFETFSVLTRLPSPARLTAAAARRAIATNFPHSRFLSPEAAGALTNALADHGVAGGSVYDALVGATAREHSITLCSRDRRAIATYRALEVDVYLIE